MGILYIVSTPIGNMEDMTQRAIEILSRVDFILTEDTRHSGRLLKKLLINKPLISFHEHNEVFKIAEVTSKLKEGHNLALISDAGTPTLSDPGFKLVRECIKENIKVSPIPGASSILSALVASGLPTDSFVFLGYVPKKDGKKKLFYEKILKQLTEFKITVIFFESPHRLNRTLEDLESNFPQRFLSIARELTKINEEITYGSVKEVADKFKNRKVKGEITLVLH